MMPKAIADRLRLGGKAVETCEVRLIVTSIFHQFSEKKKIRLRCFSRTCLNSSERGLSKDASKPLHDDYKNKRCVNMRFW